MPGVPPPTMVAYLGQGQSLGISMAICNRLRADDYHAAAVAGNACRSLATLETAAAGDRSLLHAYLRN